MASAWPRGRAAAGRLAAELLPAAWPPSCCRPPGRAAAGRLAELLPAAWPSCCRPTAGQPRRPPGPGACGGAPAMKSCRQTLPFFAGKRSRFLQANAPDFSIFAGRSPRFLQVIAPDFRQQQTQADEVIQICLISRALAHVRTQNLCPSRVGLAYHVFHMRNDPILVLFVHLTNAMRAGAGSSTMRRNSDLLILPAMSGEQNRCFLDGNSPDATRPRSTQPDSLSACSSAA